MDVAARARDRVMGRASDLRHLSPGGRLRVVRKRTKKLVVHRIAASEDGAKRKARNAEDAISFFVSNPEGVATVTLSGSYASKKDTIVRWHREGIPEEKAAASFCPYHLIVEPGGDVCLCLDIDVVGAHAVGANADGIAIALLGDFRPRDELALWERRLNLGDDQLSDLAQRALRETVRDLLLAFGELSLLTHDDVNVARGKPAKGCPGDFAEDLVRSAFSWARTAADNVRATR